MDDVRSSNQDRFGEFKFLRGINPVETSKVCEFDVARHTAPRKRAFPAGRVFLRFFTLSGFRGIA